MTMPRHHGKGKHKIRDADHLRQKFFRGSGFSCRSHTSFVPLSHIVRATPPYRSCRFPISFVPLYHTVRAVIPHRSYRYTTPFVPLYHTVRAARQGHPCRSSRPSMYLAQVFHIFSQARFTRQEQTKRPRQCRRDNCRGRCISVAYRPCRQGIQSGA